MESNPMPGLVPSGVSDSTLDDESMATASIEGSTWSINSFGDISRFIKQENGRVSTDKSLFLLDDRGLIYYNII